MAEKLIPTDFFTTVQTGVAPVPLSGGVLGVQVSGGTASAVYQMGYEFLVNEVFEISGLRIYTANVVAELLQLWDVATQTLLASVEVTGEGILDWHRGAITPLTLEAGKLYAVTAYGKGVSRDFQFANYATGITWNPKITYQQHRYANNDANYPANTVAGATFFMADVSIGEPAPEPRTFNTLVPTDIFSG